MKPGSIEGAILLEDDREIRLVGDALAVYLRKGESSSILEILDSAKAPFELEIPFSEVVIDALRRSTESSYFESVSPRSSELLAGIGI